MFRNFFKPFFVSIAVAATALPSLAQVAQAPLLNRPNTVSPNLTLALDTSGSMAYPFIYTGGVINNPGLGLMGPDLTDTTTITPLPYTGLNDKGTVVVSRGFFSPEVNGIAYNPRVRYLPRVTYTGSNLSTNSPSNKWWVFIRNPTLNTTNCPAGNNYTTGQVSLATCFYTTAYTPTVAEVVAGSVATYPNAVDTATTPVATQFPKFIGRTDCTTSATACTLIEEQQNHSNWNKWYSTRALMTVTGLGAAFQPITANSIRLGYGTIASLNGGSLSRGVASYDATAGGVKNSFFTWLYGLSFGGGTPNLAAVNNVGRYYERTDSDGPWATLPNPASTGVVTTTATGPGAAEVTNAHASCRRSFSMLITDGYYNDGTRPTTAGNSDGTVAAGISIPPPVGGIHQPYPALISPYRDGTSAAGATNTLADLAMHYWVRDLRPDLENRVPTLTANGINNSSFWQNASFYAVSLGLDGTLARTPATLANLTSGATPWPVPTNNNPTTIDDMWHATINGRGDFLNAKNSAELSDGIGKFLVGIAGTPQTLSGVAVSTNVLKAGTRKYTPKYVPGTWSGKLAAIVLNPTTGDEAVPPVIAWEVESGTVTTTGPTYGDPISTIPAAAARNIVTWTGLAAVPFTSAATIGSNPGMTTDVVNYLRGDSSKELRKAGGIYRSRAAKLGDIVNSSPAYVKDNLDIRYGLLGGTQGSTYAAFVATKAARTEGVLFVGANDGMLHAFRDSDGIEIFGYVPQAVVKKTDIAGAFQFQKLADFSYTHQYYVDGPNTETDAYVNGAWRNMVLGTTGAGAKAVYALDVTTPLFMNASKVMWEVNSTTTGFTNLGHVLSEVQSGYTVGGQWIAIFGNGYDSLGGNARVYVVNLETGALLKEFNPDPLVTGNGMGGVRVVRDVTHRIIGAYAGDLKGNMWKFDLTGASPSDWKMGLSGAPLFKTAGGQPITAAPSVMPRLAGQGNEDYVVVFGTGKFFETSDSTDYLVPGYVPRRLYGVWDKQPFLAGTLSTPAGAALDASSIASQFVEQTISSTVVTIPGPPLTSTTYYNISSNAVNWGNGVTGTRGWYMNFLPANAGERLVYPIDRLVGTIVLATTLSPSSPTNPDMCVQSGSGTGWGYIFDGVTGSGLSKQAVDTNGNGVVDSGDLLVSGFQVPPQGGLTPIDIVSGPGIYQGDGTKGGLGDGRGDNTVSKTLCLAGAGADCIMVDIRCGQRGTGACPLPSTLKSREWRQLFMR